MTIHYILRDNKLTADPLDQMAVVIPEGSMDIEQFIQRMVDAGSVLGPTDLVASFDLITRTILQVLLEGKTVNLPFGGYGVGLRGKFVNAEIGRAHV